MPKIYHGLTVVVSDMEVCRGARLKWVGRHCTHRGRQPECDFINILVHFWLFLMKWRIFFFGIIILEEQSLSTCHTVPIRRKYMLRRRMHDANGHAITSFRRHFELVINPSIFEYFKCLLWTHSFVHRDRKSPQPNEVNKLWITFFHSYPIHRTRIDFYVSHCSDEIIPILLNITFARNIKCKLNFNTHFFWASPMQCDKQCELWELWFCNRIVKHFR